LVTASSKPPSGWTVFRADMNLRMIKAHGMIVCEQRARDNISNKAIAKNEMFVDQRISLKYLFSRPERPRFEERVIFM